ncbi:MAG: oxaloacetate decarboxylase subunit alpha [Christensenellales bacterium]|jgi:oxaloacetate decarboxylase alpha subunit
MGVKITETILRDAHQSQAATRMTTAEMLPVADKLNQVGYWSLECWGGATFDSCLRYLREDPWDRVRALKKAIPDTKLQMLLRGQNLLGYKHYADDMVDAFVKAAIQNGIDVIRIFDALNDPRNIEQAVKATIKYGAHAQVAMSYTTSPVHTLEYFADQAAEFEKMGAHSICIKDMAGLLLPYAGYELVKMIKSKVSIPVDLHTHNTAGIGDMTLLKAVEAGVDIIDTALSPLGNGTAQPATEPLVKALQNTAYDTGLSLTLLNEIAVHFKRVASRLMEEGHLDPRIMGVDINALLYQVPGGMLSNLISQLKNQNADNRLLDVLEEVPRVREDFGYPPLVTPTSQIVGTQAVLNVLSGERYKLVTKESKALLKGEYGRLPGEKNPDLVKKILGDEPLTTHRPADDIPPELPKYREELKQMGYLEQEEDVLSYAMFPQVAPDYFKYRQTAKYKIDTSVSGTNKIQPI